MDAVIQHLLTAGGLKVAVPLAVVGFAVIAIKGGFGLHRSRSANRKDFLDVFRDWEARGDLWLSVSVRHCFGEYLPPSLIRKLMAGPDPARALLDVSNGWGAFMFDPKSLVLRWRNPRNGNARRRKWKRWALMIGYFGLACSASLIGYWAVRTDLGGVQALIAWVYTLLGIFAAIICLVEGDRLKDASDAAERWLELDGQGGGSSVLSPALTARPKSSVDIES